MFQITVFKMFLQCLCSSPTELPVLVYQDYQNILSVPVQSLQSNNAPLKIDLIIVVIVLLLSHVWLICHPVACRPPGLYVGFPMQEYWSGLPYSSPGDLPNPGIKPMSPALAGGFFTREPPG